MKQALLVLALACMTHFAYAQTPSGLLTGPVTYTSPLNNSAYGNHWSFADGTSCFDNCPYIVHYVVGTDYSALTASDGTGNCYGWDVWQMSLGPCQSSFHGGAPGETTVGLYCGNSISSDINGKYSLSCTASFDGTAITVQGGIDVPIPALYTVNVTITHHSVRVWIPAHFRTPRHLETWQTIDSAVVTVAPPPTPAVQANIGDGPARRGKEAAEIGTLEATSRRRKETASRRNAQI